MYFGVTSSRRKDHENDVHESHVKCRPRMSKRTWRSTWKFEVRNHVSQRKPQNFSGVPEAMSRPQTEDPSVKGIDSQ